MNQNPKLLTPDSLPMPPDRANNFWYIHIPADTVVVFVHGIFSDSRSCWLYEDTGSGRKVFWPDLVRTDEQLGMLSIYLAGYYTNIDSGDFSVRDCARELLEALERPEKNKSPVLSSANIIFECHSLGGIVTRYMLERNKEIFRNKRVGLALIASPSLGSVWANVASLAAYYKNQRLGLQLQWQGEALEDINGRFRDLVDKKDAELPWLFGMEACEHKMIFRERIPKWIRGFLPNRLKLVTTLSAGQFFGEAKVLPGTDHFSVVKPDGFHHPSHEFLVTFMRRFREMLAERRDETTGARFGDKVNEDNALTSPQRKGRFKLTEGSLLSNPRFFETNADTATIGRAPDRDFVLNDPKVSWHHGFIERTTGEYRYHHTSETNPTVIRRHHQEFLLTKGRQSEITLYNNDRILVGDRELTVEFDLIAGVSGYVTTDKDENKDPQ